MLCDKITGEAIYLVHTVGLFKRFCLPLYPPVVCERNDLSA